MKAFKSIGVLLLAIFAAGSAFGQGQTIYNSIPAPLPGNLGSLGNEAYSQDELGDRVQFGGTHRKLTKVTQTMSSWGCEAGNWYTVGSCISGPGATFSHPITLNIYNVGPGDSVGSLITSVTQTFAIPYRPSADSVNCDGKRWYSATENRCFNGLAVNVTFDVPAVSVPNQVIYGIAYNTSHSGNSPIGDATACYASSGGCGYDSLNIALEGVVSAGTNPAPFSKYWDTAIASWYCDGGAGGSDSFRLDAGCWFDPGDPTFSYLPSVKFYAVNPPASAHACKNGGWQTLTRLDGTAFKNQGDCIQYVNNGH